ncbi:hypothetical protein ACFL03_08785 [Thermodesulfobacteriota bacterium]
MDKRIERNLLSYRSNWQGYEVLYRGRAIGWCGLSRVYSLSDYDYWSEDRFNESIHRNIKAAKKDVEDLVNGRGKEKYLASIDKLEQNMFFCAACKNHFYLYSQTNIPWFNSTMDMMVTAGFCPTCLPEAIKEAKRFIDKAKHRDQSKSGHRLKNNIIIEHVARFFERYCEATRHRAILEFSNEIRDAVSADAATSKINDYLDKLSSREIELPVPY